MLIWRPTHSNLTDLFSDPQLIQNSTQRMAGNLLRLSTKHVLKTCRFTQPTCIAHYHDNHSTIGNREVVGFGLNGEPSYLDRTDAPMPAIRYKEENEAIRKLREKEKGDWKNLTTEEKKELYRTSYCQTFAEMDAPTGDWKQILGMTLIGVSLSIWIMVFMDKFGFQPPSQQSWLYLQLRKSSYPMTVDVATYGKRFTNHRPPTFQNIQFQMYYPFPSTFSPEAKQKQLEYMIKARVDPIEGISSKWDYEKGQWKE
ncbi:Cytochrome c oxidase subunit 4 isoform 2, mitochondrial [Nymphon striatum]|nr:Cytochrome c oxidase subunit 4 isoform 2, mitochondrial [Nymphon striatum]